MYISATMDIDTTLTHEVKSDLEVITAGYAVVEEGDAGANRPSGWPDYQLLYIKNGMGHFLIDKEEIVISAGTAIIFHPYEPQIYRYLQKECPETYWIHIGGSRLGNILKELGIFENRIFHIYNDKSLIDAIHRTVDELIVQEKGYHQVAIGHAIRAFVCVARNKSRRPDNSLWDAVDQMRIKIRREYTSNETNAEYAAQLNMSVSHFLSLFKKITGTTPQQYKLQLRIAAAKNMLLNTQYKISDIAQNVGFGDSLYFCRYFRNSTGVSPSKFRRTGK